MDRTNDMRKTRSRQYLTDALLELMQEKDFESISVNEIVKKARVSRSTFYFQFEDKYFFVNRIIDDVLADLRREASPSRKAEHGLERESHDYYKRHFEYIYDHAQFFVTMLGPHGAPLFNKKFEESAHRTYREIFSTFEGGGLGESLDYFIQYIISAHIGITIKWINGGLRESPAYMSELLTRLTFRGLLHGLEMDQQVTLPQ